MFMRFEPYSLSSQPMAFPSSTDTQPWIYLYNCTNHFVSLKFKKNTDLNSLKTKIYFDLWFPFTDSWLLKYGQVVRPSITVVGMCGKGRGTLLTSCQKAERATEEGDGESCKPFKHISSVTRFVRSAPTFHISTNPNIVSNY